MYWKITDKKSIAFSKIEKFLLSISQLKKDNNQKIREYTGLDFKEYYGYTSPFCLNGTVDAIVPIINKKNKDFVELNLQCNWKQCKDFPEAWEPNKRKKQGRQLAEFMESLPRLTFRDDNAIYGVKTEGKWVHFGYEWIKKDGGILVTTQDDVEFKPLKGMVEITKGEFDKLKVK
ncbi:MAG: hypothetical protein V4547_18090 [Bacteroidota bacterium]